MIYTLSLSLSLQVSICCRCPSFFSLCTRSVSSHQWDGGGRRFGQSRCVIGKDTLSPLAAHVSLSPWALSGPHSLVMFSTLHTCPWCPWNGRSRHEMGRACLDEERGGERREERPRRPITLSFPPLPPVSLSRCLSWLFSHSPQPVLLSTSRTRQTLSLSLPFLEYDAGYILHQARHYPSSCGASSSLPLRNTHTHRRTTPSWLTKHTLIRAFFPSFPLLSVQCVSLRVCGCVAHR